ncbi:MAG TPA: nuclease [Desulfobulbaceae bacterium]|nr:nuclease [Desulfobulbaceae bacterium]
MTRSEMVSTGYAWVYPRYCRLPSVRKEYERGEQLARATRCGLWRDQNPIPPWKWRRFGKKG